MGLNISGLCPLIQVFDMPTSIRFYRDILGFEVAMSSPVYGTEDGEPLFHWALLRANGGAELMLNTAYDEGERPDRPDPERIIGHRDLGLFLSCPDPDAACRGLQAKGCKCRPPHTAPFACGSSRLATPTGTASPYDGGRSGYTEGLKEFYAPRDQLDRRFGDRHSIAGAPS